MLLCSTDMRRKASPEPQSVRETLYPQGKVVLWTEKHQMLLKAPSPELFWVVGGWGGTTHPSLYPSKIKGQKYKIMYPRKPTLIKQHPKYPDPGLEWEDKTLSSKAHEPLRPGTRDNQGPGKLEQGESGQGATSAPWTWGGIICHKKHGTHLPAYSHLPKEAFKLPFK